MTAREVNCTYCQQPAELVDSAVVYRGKSYGMIWRCAPCDAYVGVHKHSPDFEPLGRMANGELRRLKRETHDAFDPIWRDGSMSRAAAYGLLSRLMGLDEDVTHIGMFDGDQCKRAVEVIAVWRMTHPVRQTVKERVW